MTVVFEGPTTAERPVPLTVNKQMIDEQLWGRLVQRIVSESHGEINETLAVRILDQALAFLKLVSESPRCRFAPSPTVDISWHTFILYTREYMAFCKHLCRAYFWQQFRQVLTNPRRWTPSRVRRLVRLYRRTYIHHSPNDVPGVDYSSKGTGDTVRALRDHGLIVDDLLWVKQGNPCDDSHDEDCDVG